MHSESLIKTEKSVDRKEGTSMPGVCGIGFDLDGLAGNRVIPVHRARIIGDTNYRLHRRARPVYYLVTELAR